VTELTHGKINEVSPPAVTVFSAGNKTSSKQNLKQSESKSKNEAFLNRIGIPDLMEK
jgi:hypothetical protein